jgi:hypothetical protein
MKFMQNHILIVCILFFPVFCHSQSVTYKKGTHVPLIFIMEQNKNETPTMQKVGPETRDLEIGILERNAPILVSKAILYNFVFRKQNWNDLQHPENETLKDISLSKEDWEFYVPTNTHYFANNNQLYLLMPSAKKNLFTHEIFNINALQKLDIIPSHKDNDYSALLETLKPDKHLEEKIPSKETVKEITHDLKKIFATLPPPTMDGRSLAIHRQEMWEMPIWDIYFSGHGAPKPDPVIANLTPLELQEFLTFCNIYIRVGVLIISSCYGGGEILTYLKFKEDINNDKIFFPLNFIIIVNSIGDIPTFAASYAVSYLKTRSFFAPIFDIAQNLGNDTYHSLSNLLRILGEFNPVTQDIFAQANIPQIILPGGIEIQSLTPSDSVMVIGKVKARVAELENKPIAVYPRKLHDNPKFEHMLNVLVYPQLISMPVIVRSSHLPLDIDLKQLTKKQWENLPTFSDILTRNEKFFDAEKQLIFTKRIDISKLKNNQYLYPNIISMIHGNSSQFFRKMVFKGNAFKGSGGILMALRDAFCNLTERLTKKIFYIESLEGPNDLSLILKAKRALANNPNELPLEKELPGDGAPIVLQNVTISTQDEYGMEILVQFQINKMAWQYKYEAFHWESPEVFKPQWWNFLEINASEYEKKFKEATRTIIHNNKSLMPKKKQKPLSSIFEKEHRKRIYELQQLPSESIEKK